MDRVEAAPPKTTNLLRLGTFFGEELLQQHTAFGFAHAAGHHATVIESGKVEQVEGGSCRTRFGIADAKYDP